MTWIKYEPSDRSDYVPTSDWGKDHWSTFAYLETRAVNYQGTIDNTHMRCNNRLHRHFVVRSPFDRDMGVDSKYPTRLKNGELERHDDWSCLEDMVAAGYVKAEVCNAHIRSLGGAKARIKITPAGQLVSAQLRAFKMDGGHFADFELP